MEPAHDAAMFEPPSVHPDRPGIIAPVRVDPRGLTGPTRAQARGSRWRRSTQGLFVPSSTDERCLDQRIVEMAAVLPAFGGVTGWAALAWQGGRWFGGRTAEGWQDVTLATGGLHVRSQPGVAICEEKLGPGDLAVVDGLRVTTAVRSVCFEMRYARSLRDAVIVLDMAAYSDLVSIEELSAYAYRHPAWTGIPQCRDAIPYADENAWSPMEVEMGWIWRVEAGCPTPECNRPVFDRTGRHVGTPDLIDPDAGVLGQYDGGLHLTGDQRAKDLRQEAEYRALGLECVTMVAKDRRDGGTPFVKRLWEAYERAALRPESSRRWTVDPPARWTPTSTVEQRRALDDAQRARLLRYRFVG